jgi:hypothetical protein
MGDPALNIDGPHVKGGAVSVLDRRSRHQREEWDNGIDERDQSELLLTSSSFKLQSFIDHRWSGPRGSGITWTGFPDGWAFREAVV